MSSLPSAAHTNSSDSTGHISFAGEQWLLPAAPGSGPAGPSQQVDLNLSLTGLYDSATHRRSPSPPRLYQATKAHSAQGGFYKGRYYGQSHWMNFAQLVSRAVSSEPPPMCLRALSYRCYTVSRVDQNYWDTRDIRERSRRCHSCAMQGYQPCPQSPGSADSPGARLRQGCNSHPCRGRPPHPGVSPNAPAGLRSLGCRVLPRRLQLILERSGGLCRGVSTYVLPGYVHWLDVLHTRNQRSTSRGSSMDLNCFSMGQLIQGEIKIDPSRSSDLLPFRACAPGHRDK